MSNQSIWRPLTKFSRPGDMELRICVPLLYKMWKQLVSVSFRIYYANTFVKKRRKTMKNLSNDYQSEGPNRLKRIMKLGFKKKKKKTEFLIHSPYGYIVSLCKQLEVTADRIRTSSLWLRMLRFVLLFYRLLEITVLLRVRENCSISLPDTPLYRTKADCILDHRWPVLTPETVVSCPFKIFILVPHHTTNSVHKFFNHKYTCFSTPTRFELLGHVQEDQVLLAALLHRTGTRGEYGL
jgi:hypothetical protein